MNFIFFFTLFCIFLISWVPLEARIRIAFYLGKKTHKVIIIIIILWWGRKRGVGQQLDGIGRKEGMNVMWGWGRLGQDPEERKQNYLNEKRKIMRRHNKAQRQGRSIKEEEWSSIKSEVIGSRIRVKGREVKIWSRCSGNSGEILMSSWGWAPVRSHVIAFYGAP